MNFDARRLKVWVGRVLANAIFGGLWFAFIAALCGAIAGGICGALFYDFEISGTLACAMFGALFGIPTGVAGVIIYGIAAGITAPGELFQPYESLAKRVAWGQLAGTLSACSAFIIFWLVKAQVTGTTLKGVFAEDHLFVISAPVLMVCGAIISALFKRNLPKGTTIEKD